MTAPRSSPPRASLGATAQHATLQQSPFIPVGLLVIGAYLCWFGVHYWRTDVKWPTDPIKALLQGKPLPVATPPDAKFLGRIITSAYETGSDGSSGGGSGGGGGTPPGSNAQIAAAALKYQGAGYRFGGNASSVGQWDCSSFVSYVLGHDLGLPLPGGKWGDPGFPPHAHGPVAASYKLYGTGVSSPAAGDIVAWNTHVGIALDNNRIVSARTPSEGTGTSTISGTSKSINETPVFRRVTLSSPGKIVNV